MRRVGRVLPRQYFETAARQALDLFFEIPRAPCLDDPNHGMCAETASAQRRFVGAPGRGDVAEMVEQQSQANRADSYGAAESNPGLGLLFPFPAVFDRDLTAGRTAESTTALFAVSSERNAAMSDLSRNTTAWCGPGGSAGMTGFEPAVSALTGQRVGPLHHTPNGRESTIPVRGPRTGGLARTGGGRPSFRRSWPLRPV